MKKTQLSIVIVFVLSMVVHAAFPGVPIASSFSTAVPANRESAITLLGSDPDGTALTYATDSGPSHGTLSNLNTSTGVVIYTPAPSYTGPDSFTYTVTSGGQTSSAGTVTLTVTNAKTRIIDAITDPSGAPRHGTITFILTQPVTSPSGLIPVGSTVSAVLNNQGQFDVSVFPSRSLSPQAYYQVWFVDATTRAQTLIGIYDIPLATNVIVLAPYKVTDTNLAARYTFASSAAVSALIQAASSATLAALTSTQVIGALGYTPMAPAANLGDVNSVPLARSNLGLGTMAQQAASAVAISGGTLNGVTCTNCTGIGGGNNGSTSNLNDTVVAADTDSDGTGGVKLQTRGLDRLLIGNDGTVTIPGIISAPTQLPITPICTGTNDTAVFSTIISALGSNAGTIKLPNLGVSRCAVNNLTIPANVTLDNSDGTGLKINTGQTLTLVRRPVNPEGKQVFFNALSGQGTVSLPGELLRPEWWGAKGDGTTDDTPPIQAAIDAAAANGGGTIQFGLKTYIVAGALQDTSFSNSQLTLPKVHPTSPMVSINFVGTVPPPTAVPANDVVTRIKSTLATGNGALIGVKSNNAGFPGLTSGALARTAVTWVRFHAQNINFRLPSNPTNSALDFRFTPDLRLDNVRIDVEGISYSGSPASLQVTEPTTSTSYGLLAPANYIPDSVILDNVEILGYYNGMRWGELVRARDLIIGVTKIAIDIRGAQHSSIANKILFVSNKQLLVSGGLDPFFATASDPNPHNQLTIQEMGWEDGGSPAWTTSTNHIDDASNNLFGTISWQNGIGGAGMTKVGGANLRLHQVDKPWQIHYPHTHILIGSGGEDTLDSLDSATLELYRGLSTTDSNKLPWLLLTSNQTGTANKGIGLITFNNEAIADAPSTTKILGQIDVSTDGAINQGRLGFSTSSGGVSTLWGYFDHYGNFGLGGRIIYTEGAALTISSNTIAPVLPFHTVAAGLIKNITPPLGPTAIYQHTFIPTGAFTYDATGNILVAAGGGTAVINKPMIATWVPSLSKWVMSY